MPSNNAKSQSLPRITVSLDIFDDAVVNLMAKNTGKSKSEIVRTMITHWIESNPDTLKTKYKIEYEDVQRIIQFENEERNIEDDLNQLLNFFRRRSDTKNYLKVSSIES